MCEDCNCPIKFCGFGFADGWIFVNYQCPKCGETYLSEGLRGHWGSESKIQPLPIRKILSSKQTVSPKQTEENVCVHPVPSKPQKEKMEQDLKKQALDIAQQIYEVNRDNIWKEAEEKKKAARAAALDAAVEGMGIFP